jgi:nucleotide-binding universal stress UspA family protein
MPDEQKEDLNHMAYFLIVTPHKYIVVNNISIDNVVNSYIQTNDINFTVIIVQKESLFERFFMGSSTAKIGNHLLVPLLVFHND